MRVFPGGFRRVKSYFRRRERKYQPTASRVDMMELQDIAKELAISWGVSAVEDDVSSGNRHSMLEQIDCHDINCFPSTERDFGARDLDLIGPT